MKTALEELMWAAHRAEGEAAHASDDLEGFFTDVREEQLNPVEHDKIGIDTFNLGVSNGIKVLLDHLSENGYTIIDPNGDPIKQATVGCKTELLGESWKRWLTAGGKEFTSN